MPYLDFFINITCQRFLPSYLEAEGRKWDEIRIRMIDWPHTNSYVVTHVSIRRNTLLLYPSLSPYRQTDRQTDSQTDEGTNTLASRGLEEPAHTSRGLEEPFFQLCCCVSFWFWREIEFGCTYYYVLGVPYTLHIRSIHTISCKIGHVIQIIPH